MRRWILRLTFVASAALALAAAGQPSARASCLARQGVACQLDDAIVAGEGLVDDIVPPVDTPADDKVDPVVPPIVDDVLDRVHDMLDGRPVGPPDPVGTRGRSGSHGGGPPTRVGDGPPSFPKPVDRGARGSVGGRDPDTLGITTVPGPVISAASGIAPSDSADRTFGNRFDESLGGVARGSAILLALFGLAVAFVAIQDRFDRNDPRLALAPVESDVVEFA